MMELENLNIGELCVHYKVCRIKPCYAHCDEYLPKDNYDTKRPHGEWKNGKCTNCGAECFEDDYMRDIETEFCHRCGADMRKEGEEE